MLDFVMLARRLRADGRAVSLCNAQPQIVALIELVGLDRLPGVRVDRSTATPAPPAPGPFAARLGIAHA